MSKGGGGGGASAATAPGTAGGWSDAAMRAVGINPDTIDPEDLEVMQRLGYRPEDISDLAGRGENGTMRIFAVDDGDGGAEITISVSDPRLEGQSVRSIVHEPNGNKYIYNQNFVLKQEFRGRGIGRSMLQQQVGAAQRMGINEIRTDATRGAGLTGYYAWASLGYNAELSSADIASLSSRARAAGTALPRNLGSISDVHGLFATPGGRELWKQHGFTKTMSFDTRRGSTSNRMLNARRR